MLRRIAAFEWRYQVGSPLAWIAGLIFFLIAFGATTADQIQIGGMDNTHKNSPFTILASTAVMGMFSMFVTVAMVANAVIRDDETGFAPIVRSTSIGKFGYLAGRFVGASGAALTVLAAVPLAIWVGSVMPWVDPERLGPTHLVDYLYALFAFSLPTLLVTGAIFFALATVTRSMMWSYVGAMGCVVLELIGAVLLRDPSHDPLVAVIDPFGFGALSLATKYWTVAERNTHLPPMTGYLLANRLLWLAIALVVFGVAYRVFSFATKDDARLAETGHDTAAEAGSAGSRAAREARAHRAELESLREHNPGAVRGIVAADARRARIVLPDAPPRTAATVRAQWLALTRLDMAFIFRSPVFFALVTLILLNSVGTMWFIGDLYDSPAYPVTRLMAEALDNYGFFLMLVASFYAGELVWRDRERRLHEIVDAAPVPDWVHVAPKVLALALVLLAAILIGIASGIIVQALKGWFHFDIGSYLLWYAWPSFVVLVQVAVLAVFVQVVVPHKHIGWGVMLLYVVLTYFVLPKMGFDDCLYRYARTPRMPLSDMNGIGRFWVAVLWFELYWSAFAAMLLLSCYALWRRGETVTLGARLRGLGRRLRGPWLAALAVAALAWAGSGAWIYYNTHVLNPYISGVAYDDLLADREKALLKYEAVPQPRVADVTLDVRLYPREARAVTAGRYTLVNRGSTPLSVIHLQWAERLRLDAVDLEGATVQEDFPRFHYRIYRLATPLQPGEQRTLGFRTTLEERGFRNSAPLTNLVANGTFLDSDMIAPSIGFDRHELLKDRGKRRQRGLPGELRPPKLEDDAARAYSVVGRASDWVSTDITVTTDADQTPVAPGRTVSDAVSRVDGVARRTARFRSDSPVNLMYSIQSARYDVRSTVWHSTKGDVNLAVYYQRGHEFNVERMLAYMKDSLALFSEKFSPYQFAQARIVEFPYDRLAESFANTIPYSENIGFIQDYTDPEKIDFASYVTAHEVAHQWWGHQLVPADQQGAPMLTESLAQYSALLAMESIYGRNQVRHFLKYELDAYLRARGGEALEELPLARVEDQKYIYYQKGSLAMYWAKEVLGEDVVNRALRKLLAQFAFKGPPYANTRDFIALLRAEAGPENDALITDLFERITLYDLKASGATAKKRPDGKYDLTFAVDAKKFYADGQGVETEAPMNEPVELGAFTAEPGKKAFRTADVLVLEKQRIDSGRTYVNLVVDRAPTWVGIDPYNKRIDRNSDDNLVKVELK
jgi:ABC-type transport system involved in multi-copper enzyme maturation permease subunit